MKSDLDNPNLTSDRPLSRWNAAVQTLAIVLTLLALVPCGASAGALPAATIQEFFLPMPEAQLQTSLRAIDTTGTPVGNDIKVTIAIVTGTTSTVFDTMDRDVTRMCMFPAVGFPS